MPLQVRVQDIGFSWQTRVVMEMGLELDYGVVDGMGGHTEFCIDGVCLELGFGEFPEMNAEDYVPLHPPPLQGSDISALLMMVFEMGWHQIP